MNLLMSKLNIVLADVSISFQACAAAIGNAGSLNVVHCVDDTSSNNNKKKIYNAHMVKH